MVTIIKPKDQVKWTIVLGAGSNKELEFPLGVEIYNNTIRDILNDTNSELYRILLKFQETETFQNESFVEFAKRLKASNLTSVDEFVFQHPKFERIAKAVYGYYIITAEKILDLSDPGLDHWYKFLWRNLIYTRDVKFFPKHKLSFVTFNYDRSLEHFIYESILNTYSSKLDFDHQDSRSEFFKRIPIYHVYGKLSDLPSENSNSCIDYGMKDLILPFIDDIERRVDNLAPEIKKSFENIELIFDKRHGKSERLNKIHTVLEEADAVLFLGFDFNEANMEIIGAPFGTIKNLKCKKYGFIYNFDDTNPRVKSKSETLNEKFGVLTNKKHYESIIKYLEWENIL